METIKGIVAEMRKDIPRVVDAKVILRNYADRIEQAVTNCNQFRMRKALEQAQRVLHCAIVAEILKGEDAHEALNVVTNALSQPPRNCDRFNAPDEALSAYCENEGITQPLPLWYGNEYWGLLQWLYDEAKGEAK